MATPLVNIPSVTSSNIPTNLPSDVTGLGIVLSVSGVLVVIFMFVGEPSAANGAPRSGVGARNRSVEQGGEQGGVLYDRFVSEADTPE